MPYSFEEWWESNYKVLNGLKAKEKAEIIWVEAQKAVKIYKMVHVGKGKPLSLEILNE